MKNAPIGYTKQVQDCVHANIYISQSFSCVFLSNFNNGNITENISLQFSYKK